MPEGDTIAWAANRIRPVLVGHIPDEILTPQPRHARDRWPERLEGRPVTGVETHGKHLFIRFGPREGERGGLQLHSHLGMVGRWVVTAEPRLSRAVWIVLRVHQRSVVELRGPTLELLTDDRRRFDQRLAALGPDILAETFDAERFLRNVHCDDPTRALGDALLDQTILAGVGNLWKAEGCWDAEIDPWRPLKSLTDDELLSVITALRPRMQQSGEHGPRVIGPRVYGLGGRPCPRCGTRVQAKGQGDANRTTYWCPGCQR
jgi:endonuclease VIII